MTSNVPDPEATATPEHDGQAAPAPEPETGPDTDVAAQPEAEPAADASAPEAEPTDDVPAPEAEPAADVPAPEIEPTDDLSVPDPDATPVALPEVEPDTVVPAADAGDNARRKRISGAGVLIGVLLALFGFTLVVQVRSNAGEAAYASAREGDLLQIMSDLDAAERRLNDDIASLEQTRQELQSGAAGRDAALAEAQARANALGILAGTLKAQGPGVILRFYDEGGRIKPSTLLNAVEELRGAGAEALQIDGTGGSVRIIASTYFGEAEMGVRVDGRLLRGPYTIRAIGDPSALRPAMEIPGGVKAAANQDGGKVIVDQMELVEINETRSSPDLEYARPVR